MELPRTSGEMDHWLATRLLRVVFLNNNPFFVDKFVKHADRCLREDHQELVPGLSKVMTHCLETESDAAAPARGSVLMYDKFFVILIAIIASAKTREFYRKSTSGEAHEFKLWVKFLLSEHFKFQQRLTKDGKCAATTSLVAYPNLYVFVDTVVKAFLMGTLVNV